MAETEKPDLMRDIHDMDEKERADAERRWVELSELVAPRDPKEEPKRPDGPER